MSERLPRRLLLLVAKCSVAGLLLYWLVRSGQLDFAQYRALASGPNLGLVVFATLLQALAYGFFMMRWWGLARAQGLPIGGAEVAQTGLQGLFTQLFLPGGLGADGVRVLHVRKWYRSHLVPGLASLFTDRVSGLVGLILLGSLASFVYGLVSGDQRLLPLACTFVALLAASIVAALALWAAARLPALARLWRMAAIASAVEALQAYTRRRGAVAAAIGISVIGHVVTALAAWLALMALGDAPPMLGVLAINTLLNLVRMIPITPMGLGVADGAAEVLYAQIGLSNGAELQMLTRVISMLIFAGAGFAFLVELPRRAHV